MRSLIRRGVAARLRTRLPLAFAAALVAAAGVWPGATAVALEHRSGAPAGLYLQPQDTATGGTSCVPNGAGETCSGTYSGNTAYDPNSTSVDDQGNPTYESSATPTVSISQAADLTHQILDVSWKNFTPSYSYSPNPGVNPSTEPPDDLFYGVELLECQGTDPQYDGFYSGNAPGGTPDNPCYTVSAANATDGPANEAWATTAAGTASTDNEGNINTPGISCETAQPGDTACGTGSTQFEVETSVQSSFLTCNQANPCSLVVLPQWGGDDGSTDGLSNYPADPTDQLAFTDYCTTHYIDEGLPFGAYYGTMLEVGDACSWADRFVIPLDFAPVPASFCSGDNDQFTAEGAPELEQAMEQWEPAWCKSPSGAVQFDYNSGVNEYQARSDFLGGGAALTAEADVALVTDPASAQAAAGSTRQYTYAPIVNTGIAIAYYIDNVTTGQPITGIKLDARLLAKLLTNSYSYDLGNTCTLGSATLCASPTGNASAVGIPGCYEGQTQETATCDPAVYGNPANIFDDPEFQQLNPGIDWSTAVAGGNGYNDSDTEPLVIAGNSDMTYELTRWIESDPDAAAFLKGEPDPWGMHVNTYYKTQAYPVSEFEELDPGFTEPAWTSGSNSVVQTMQALWNPITGQDNVDENMLGWTSSGLSQSATCLLDGEPAPACLPTTTNLQSHMPPQGVGARTLFAVVDTADAGAFQFPTAELVNSAGNAVGPTVDGMSAALGSMQTNPDKVTQYQNFQDTSPNAYPLTEVEYAMVPTCGEPAAKAQAISEFLSNVTKAQTYGTDSGELPEFGGYLALSATQQAQTIAAAQAVASQNCTSTAPPDTTVGGSTGNAAGGTTGTVGGDSGLGLGSGGTGGVATGGSGTAGLGGEGVSSVSSPSPAKTKPVLPVALGVKGPDDSGLADSILPIVLILGALLLLGGPLAYALAGGGLGRRTGAGGGAAPAGAAPTGGMDPAGEAEGGDD